MYKKRFVDTCSFIKGTGAGITEQTNGFLKEEIEEFCPCYNWMSQIFGEKQNVMGYNISDSLIPKKQLANDSDSSHWDPSNEESASSSNSKEFLEDEEETQNSMLEGVSGQDEDAFTEPNVDQGINEGDDDQNKGGESSSRNCQSTTSGTASMKHKSRGSRVMSSPWFQEINSDTSCRQASPTIHRKSKKRKVKDSDPQHKFPEKFVSRKLQSLVVVLE
ncbi:hypothetical protein O181_087743 [Austropuccinia psidii MF-1]|uniref:Uncharacterized protein n=1 Tax=Austropuccinia psidii MF-1 TaxID=1389203 RepID=A0A9Q3P1N1_9BASI|nr:hypothetical protein [Austropuccinia psidii MF-1]